jgi:hypothetical protein
MNAASVSCLTLLTQRICWALALAFESAGNSIAARMAMMAMTTSSSISVKPPRRVQGFMNEQTGDVNFCMNDWPVEREVLISDGCE